ncbi:hypothetical protein GCM10027271_09250 [Saccharopolyspora gloriosae]
MRPDHRLADSAGLGDDVQVRLGAQQVPQAAANHFVIIDEQHAYRHVLTLRPTPPDVQVRVP